MIHIFLRYLSRIVLRSASTVLFSCLATLMLQAQVGGTVAYRFLDLTPSPQVAALGGKVNAVPGADPSLTFYNPSLLDSTSNNCLALNYVNFMAGINFGYVAYACSYRHVGNFAAGIHYVNYGKFAGADVSGILTGNFSAAEYAFNLSYSRYLPWLDSCLTVGVNVKPLLSTFEDYTSYGLLADAGITYQHPGKMFTAALVLRNMGGQLTAYSDGGREPVPFEVQLGVSQRLQHAPFRFSILIQHLERLRLGFDESDPDPSTGQLLVDDDAKSGLALFADETMRHLLFGVECFPFRALVLRASYNYNRRQDLKVDTQVGTAGFSWGAGIQLARLRIDYARSVWHLAGASNHFSIVANLGK